ncbi:MAG: Fe(2+) transporter permease subunit FeoB [Aeromonadaceae bacterium]
MNWNLMTVGNPNSGKTSLFNALTGANQQVGNWSGVTVDKKSGHFVQGEDEYQLMDLPGIYALESRDSSIDEQIAFRYAMTHKPDLVINVIDATSLERSLLLTLQLRELGLPLLVVLNKYDVMQKRRQSIDTHGLAKVLGCPVVALSAYDRKAIQGLKEQLPLLMAQTSREALTLDYGEVIEAAIAQLQPRIHHAHLAARGCAIRLLEGDPVLDEALQLADEPEIGALVQRTQAQVDMDLSLADVRYGFIHEQARPCVHQHGKLSLKGSERLDNLLLNRWLGIPIFLGVMYLMFLFAINVGSAFIDFFDVLAGALFVDGPRHWLGQWGAPEWLRSVVADGIGSGMQTVATFIPVVGFLYLFLAVLEASGYLARAAFVVDRAMRKLGLPGKAFVPMLMGFGCSVPAFMSARTLNAERERLITMSMAPFMSCGARLPVYALFAVAFFPQSGQNVVFLLYLIGIAVAVLTGLVLRKTLLPGSSESMVMEMPDYELPRPSYVLIKTWHKLRSFVLGAGKTIVLMVAVLNLFNTLGSDGSFGNENTDKSLLSQAAAWVTPVLSPLGVREDNWQATVGIATGIFAKEAVVGTLNSLYQSATDEEESPFSLTASFLEALETIPANLAAINPWDPAGLELGDLQDKQAMAEEQGVELSTFANMQSHFDGQIGAFAYLLFILLYMPCAAAMGALVREAGRNWAIFTAMWCNLMAFMIAILYYQLATFSAHPAQSVAWVAFFSLVSVLTWWGMRRKGNILASKVVLI